MSQQQEWLEQPLVLAQRELAEDEQEGNPKLNVRLLRHHRVQDRPATDQPELPNHFLASLQRVCASLGHCTE